MAKKNKMNLIGRRKKTHGVKITKSKISNTWKRIKERIKGEAKEIPLNILMKQKSSFTVEIPCEESNALFDIVNNKTKIDIESDEWKNLVSEAFTIRTTDEEWAKKHLFNSNGKRKKIENLEKNSVTVKNVKWCLEKNKTIIFDNIEENISWLESVRSKIKNILILMGNGCSEAYDFKNHHFDVDDYILELKTFLTWSNFQEYVCKKKLLPEAKKTSRRYENVRRIFYDEIGNVIEGLVDSKFILKNNFAAWSEKILEQRIQDEEKGKVRALSEKRK